MNLSFLKEKKNKYIVIILLSALVLVLLLPTSSGERDAVGASVSENVQSTEMEAQLKRVLSAMEGGGEVEVMITFEMVENSLFGASGNTGKVCGVVIVADGAGNAVVETRILNAVKALFSIEAHKISIVKRAIQEDN